MSESSLPSKKTEAVTKQDKAPLKNNLPAVKKQKRVPVSVLLASATAGDSTALSALNTAHPASPVTGKRLGLTEALRKERKAQERHQKVTAVIELQGGSGYQKKKRALLRQITPSSASSLRLKWKETLSFLKAAKLSGSAFLNEKPGVLGEVDKTIKSQIKENKEFVPSYISLPPSPKTKYLEALFLSVRQQVLKDKLGTRTADSIGAVDLRRVWFADFQKDSLFNVKRNPREVFRVDRLLNKTVWTEKKTTKPSFTAPTNCLIIAPMIKQAGVPIMPAYSRAAILTKSSRWGGYVQKIAARPFLREPSPAFSISNTAKFWRDPLKKKPTRPRGADKPHVWRLPFIHYNVAKAKSLNQALFLNKILLDYKMCLKKMQDWVRLVDVQASMLLELKSILGARVCPELDGDGKNFVYKYPWPEPFKNEIARQSYLLSREVIQPGFIQAFHETSYVRSLVATVNTDTYALFVFERLHENLCLVRLHYLLSALSCGFAKERSLLLLLSLDLEYSSFLINPIDLVDVEFFSFSKVRQPLTMLWRTQVLREMSEAFDAAARIEDCGHSSATNALFTAFAISNSCFPKHIVGFSVIVNRLLVVSSKHRQKKRVKPFFGRFPMWRKKKSKKKRKIKLRKMFFKRDFYRAARRVSSRRRVAATKLVGTHNKLSTTYLGPQRARHRRLLSVHRKFSFLFSHYTRHKPGARSRYAGKNFWRKKPLKKKKLKRYRYARTSRLKKITVPRRKNIRRRLASNANFRSTKRLRLLHFFGKLNFNRRRAFCLTGKTFVLVARQTGGLLARKKKKFRSTLFFLKYKNKKKNARALSPTLLRGVQQLSYKNKDTSWKKRKVNNRCIVRSPRNGKQAPLLGARSAQQLLASRHLRGISRLAFAHVWNYKLIYRKWHNWRSAKGFPVRKKFLSRIQKRTQNLRSEKKLLNAIKIEKNFSFRVFKPRDTMYRVLELNAGVPAVFGYRRRRGLRRADPSNFSFFVQHPAAAPYARVFKRAFPQNTSKITEIMPSIKTFNTVIYRACVNFGLSHYRVPAAYHRRASYDFLIQTFYNRTAQRPRRFLPFFKAVRRSVTGLDNKVSRLRARTTVSYYKIRQARAFFRRFSAVFTRKQSFFIVTSKFSLVPVPLLSQTVAFRMLLRGSLNKYHAAKRVIDFVSDLRKRLLPAEQSLPPWVVSRKKRKKKRRGLLYYKRCLPFVRQPFARAVVKGFSCLTFRRNRRAFLLASAGYSYIFDSTCKFARKRFGVYNIVRKKIKLSKTLIYKNKKQRVWKKKSVAKKLPVWSLQGSSKTSRPVWGRVLASLSFLPTEISRAVLTPGAPLSRPPLLLNVKHKLLLYLSECALRLFSGLVATLVPSVSLKFVEAAYWSIRFHLVNGQKLRASRAHFRLKRLKDEIRFRANSRRASNADVCSNRYRWQPKVGTPRPSLKWGNVNWLRTFFPLKQTVYLEDPETYKAIYLPALRIYRVGPSRRGAGNGFTQRLHSKQEDQSARLLSGKFKPATPRFETFLGTGYSYPPGGFILRQVARGKPLLSFFVRQLSSSPVVASRLLRKKQLGCWEFPLLAHRYRVKLRSQSKVARRIAVRSTFFLASTSRAKSPRSLLYVRRLAATNKRRVFPRPFAFLFCRKLPYRAKQPKFFWKNFSQIYNSEAVLTARDLNQNVRLFLKKKTLLKRSVVLGALTPKPFLFTLKRFLSLKILDSYKKQKIKTILSNLRRTLLTKLPHKKSIRLFRLRLVTGLAAPKAFYVGPARNCRVFASKKMYYGAPTRVVSALGAKAYFCLSVNTFAARRIELWSALTARWQKKDRVLNYWLKRMKRKLKLQRGSWASYPEKLFKEMRFRLRQLTWNERDDYFDRKDLARSFSFGEAEKLKAAWLEFLMYRRAAYSTRLNIYRRYQVPREQKRLKWLQQFRKQVIVPGSSKKYLRGRRWPKYKLYNNRLFLSLFALTNRKDAYRRFKKLNNKSSAYSGWSRASLGLFNRLDVIVILLGVAPSSFWAAVMLDLGVITVIGKPGCSASYCLQPGDAIAWSWEKLQYFRAFFTPYSKHSIPPLVQAIAYALPKNLRHDSSINAVVYTRHFRAKDLRQSGRIDLGLFDHFRMGAKTGK